MEFNMSYNNTEAENLALEAQVQTAMEFQTELVGANHSRLLSGMAVERDGSAWRVAIDDIRIIPHFNVRVKNAAYHAHIENLTKSIIENGYYRDKPIAGYLAQEGKKLVIYCTDGHCRLEAIRKAIALGTPISEVPVILKEKSTTLEDLTVALVRSNDGLKLSPLELAIACKRLVDFGWSYQTIATKIGITEVYVGQLLTLAGAPKSIREMIESGSATAAVALSALRDHGSEAPQVMAKALEEAKAKGKGKLTSKFLPNAVLKRAQTKNAPVMFTAIEQIKADKGFTGLSPDVQELVQKVLESIEKAKIDAAARAENEAQSAENEPKAEMDNAA
jgi:ParB family chromosome partitioning protein